MILFNKDGVQDHSNSGLACIINTLVPSPPPSPPLSGRSLANPNPITVMINLIVHVRTPRKCAFDVIPVGRYGHSFEFVKSVLEF